MASLQVRSVLIGAAVAAGLLFLMSQATPVFTPSIRVQYGPHPRDMVQIKEGTPYVVPVGKILVITALGVSDTSGVGWPGVELRVGNVRSFWTTGYPQGLTVNEVPAGFTVPAGSSVAPVTAGGYAPNAFAWGYLSEQ